MAGMDWVRPSEFSATLAAVLRAARRDAGMTLRSVRRASDGYFRPSAVNGYERGHRQISIERLCHLAEVYGTTGDELVRRTLAALGHAPSPPAERNRSETLRMFYRSIIQDGDVSAIAELCTPGFVDHEIPARLDLPRNADGFRSWIETLHRTFTEVAVDVEDMMVVGDQAVVRIEQTLLAPALPGRPGPPARVKVAASEWLRFDGDKISERWGIDGAWLLDQAAASTSADRS